MKEYENPYSEESTALIAVDSNRFLTGNKAGIIRLWELHQDGEEITFYCTQSWHEHTKPIVKLVLLPHGDFVSLSENNMMKVWDISKYSSVTSMNLESGAVYTCSDIIALDDDLIVIAGSLSPAWECFDVWDIRSSQCIFSRQGSMHRPHGVSLGRVGPNLLAVSGHCYGEISIWSISHTECVQIAKCPNERIYSMAISPLGEIITAGFDINVFQLRAGNMPYLYKTMSNSNVIDQIVPLGNYCLFTEDRRGGGRMKIWNYLFNLESELGYDNGRCNYIFLKDRKLLLSTSGNKFYFEKLPTLEENQEFLEIRKNARLLAQSYRTQGLFSLLSPELNQKIAAMTGEFEDNLIGEKIAVDHFCRP